MESKELRNRIQQLGGGFPKSSGDFSWVLSERQMDEIMAAVTAEVERAKLLAVTHIMSAKTEGLFDGPDLFIKRAPIEQACVDLIGFEAFKTIQESLPKAQSQAQKVSNEGRI